MKMRRLAAQIMELKAQMKALGMFTNDRELLECPNCNLAEDVSADGLLFTFHRSGTDWTTDSGLPSSILNEKVRTVSAQLPLNLEKLLNNLLELSHGFCFDARQKRLLIGSDQPPIGILLCTRKNHKMVEFALAGMNNTLFVLCYQVQLPGKEEIVAFLHRAVEELGCGDE